MTERFSLLGYLLHGVTEGGLDRIMMCPCCENPDIIRRDEPFECFSCSRCRHLWRVSTIPGNVDYYVDKIGRSPSSLRDLQRKFRERFKFIRNILNDGARLLEIGCADGLFGKFIKENLTYHTKITGIEVSRDAYEAENYLDVVHHGPTRSFFGKGCYDIIMMFHVLEHVSDLEEIIEFCRKYLSNNGRMVLEVPHGAGNVLIPFDRHIEHCHFFSVTSISAFLERHGFTIETILTGCYESATYNDATRILCRLALSPEQKQALYRKRFLELFGDGCVIFGAGKDFANWVEPYIDPKWIIAIVDNNTALHGNRVAGCTVISPAGVLGQHGGKKFLVTTYRYAQEIFSQLIDLGVPEENIVSLDKFFNE